MLKALIIAAPQELYLLPRARATVHCWGHYIHLVAILPIHGLGATLALVAPFWSALPAERTSLAEAVPRQLQYI